MPDLEPRWPRTWTALGLTAPPRAWFEQLVARYREPHRAYHTLQHLEECFTLLDELRPLAEAPAVIELALWYHDAVYWPRRSDNEAASAELARQDLESAGATVTTIETVTALIVATAHQATPPPGDPAILIDIDLAILGAAPARFAEYERQIRQEYSWVPGFLFRKKRAEVLAQFLARPRIFATPLLHDRLEATARRNLSLVIGA